MRIVVVLPAPLDPQKPNIEPGATGEADAVEHVVVAEALVEPVELEHLVLLVVAWLFLPANVSARPARGRAAGCGVISG